MSMETCMNSLNKPVAVAVFSVSDLGMHHVAGFGCQDVLPAHQAT
jgi:hypothetical protein